MPCVHLKQLYQLCEENQIRIGGLDIIRLVCKKCNVKEVCPAVLSDEYDAKPTAPDPASKGAEHPTHPELR